MNVFQSVNQHCNLPALVRQTSWAYAMTVTGSDSKQQSACANLKHTLSSTCHGRENAPETNCLSMPTISHIHPLLLLTSWLAILKISYLKGYSEYFGFV